MEVIDFIDLADLDAAGVAKAVNKYIADRKQILNTLDVNVRICIVKVSKTQRAGKFERMDMLKQLIAADPSTPTVWEGGKYVFDFANFKFRCGKQELYVTPGEAVQLYQRFVRKNQTQGWSAYFANMKARLGDDFLKEFV
jgi:hypothetical protein